MLGKTISPEIMRFAVVFIILFRISFGFHLHFGLDQIFHGLTGGKSGLFNFGHHHESKQSNHTHDSSFSRDSRKGSDSSSEDPLKSIVETAGAVLNGTVDKAEKVVESTLGTVAKTAGKAEKVVEGTLGNVAKTAGKAEGIVENTLGIAFKKAGKAEGTLETVAKEAGKAEGTVEGTLGTVAKKAGKAGGIVEGTLGTVVGTVNKTTSGSTVTDKLKTATKIVGDPLDVIVKTAGGAVGGSITVDTSETAGGKAGKAKTGGTLDKPLEIVTSKAGGVAPVLEGTLKTVSGKTGGVVSSTIAESSSGVLAGKAGGAVHTLDDSLETVLGDSGGAISSSVGESSSKVVAGKAGKTKSGGTLDKSLEIVTSKTGGVVRTVGGSLEIASGKKGGTVSSSVAESYSGAVAGKAGGAVRTLGGVLETDSGRKGGVGSSSVAQSSSEAVAGRAGGAVRTLDGSLEIASGKKGGAASSSVAESSSEAVTGKAGGAVRTLGGSLKTVPGNTGGALSGIVVKSSSGSVEGKVGSVISEKVSLGTVTGNEDEEEYDVSEDNLDIIPKNVGETLGSRLASVTVGGERGLIEGIQKVPRDISNKSAANSLQTVIADVSVGEVCSSKSVVTGFPSYPPVSKFVHIFIQGVEASELLIKLFNITDATALQLSQFKYRYIADVFRKLGFIDANDIATASVRHIAKYFDVIAPEVLLRVYANAFANYIFAEGFLTNDNAEQQALSYIRTMQESAEGSGVICECDYNRNFQALGDGVFSFLLSVGEPSHSQAWGLAFYYSHEWLLAAVEYGSLRDIAVKK